MSVSQLKHTNRDCATSVVAESNLHSANSEPMRPFGGSLSTRVHVRVCRLVARHEIELLMRPARVRFRGQYLQDSERRAGAWMAGNRHLDVEYLCD